MQDPGLSLPRLDPKKSKIRIFSPVTFVFVLSGLTLAYQLFHKFVRTWTPFTFEIFIRTEDLPTKLGQFLSVQYYTGSAEACAEFLARFYPDIPLGVERIIGGPPNRDNYVASPKFTWATLTSWPDH